MKLMRRFCACLMAVLIGLCGVVPALAEEDGNVIYSGDAGEFIFTPGSEYSLTDLFPNFKDAMPGDAISQRIFVRNDASKNVKVKIYMRSLGAHEDSVEFLSQLLLQVTQVTDTVLFDAPADQTAQLTDWVCLGTFYSGAEVELDVLLTVPTSLDNRFKDLIGYLDWEFMVEEYPVEDTDPAPDTGDASNPMLYLCLLCCGALLLVFLFVTRRRKKDAENE